METPALEKVHRIPVKEPANVVQFVPRHNQDLIRNVVQKAQQIDPTFTEEQATPVSSHSIPGSQELRDVKAERIGAEPVIDIADITDIMGKTAGHAVNSVGGEEGSLTHVETVPGSKAVSYIKEKMQRLKRGFRKAA